MAISIVPSGSPQVRIVVSTGGSPYVLPRANSSWDNLIVRATGAPCTVSVALGKRLNGAANGTLTVAAGQEMAFEAVDGGHWNTPTTGSVTINASSTPGTNTVTAPTIVDGSIGTAELATGAVTITNIGAAGTASSSTFLRGDGQWAAPSAAVGSATAISGVTVSGTPTTGQVLTATTGTAASWATPTAGGGVSSVVGQTGGVTGAQILADTTVAAALTAKAPLAAPAFTGTPTTPTAALGTNTTQIASTAFVQAAASSAFGAAFILGM